MAQPEHAPVEVDAVPPGYAATACSKVAEWWATLDPGWKLSMVLLLSMRLGLQLVAALSLHFQPITVVGGDWLNFWMHGSGVWVGLLSPWQRWDALWYQHIATSGYQSGNGSTGFPPLYPALSRLLSLPLAGQIVLSELLVSTVAYLVAMATMYKLARLELEDKVSTLAVFLMTLFPTGFFLFAPYTESLYLAFVVGAFWFARRHNPWAAGLMGLGAGLTRLQGAVLVLPLAFEYVRHEDEEGRRPGLGLVWAALPAVGPIALSLFRRLLVGEQRSSQQLVAPWGKVLAPPWDALGASWHYILRTGDPIEILNLGGLLAFTLVSLGIVRRLPISYALFVWPSLALLYTSEWAVTPLAGVDRFVLVLFPCFLVLAGWLSRWPRLAAGTLIVSTLCQASLLGFWVHFGFVG